ncbi:hypothetical protein HDR60_00490 [bacterium]|nr:hypothetical protein [bacterium]
MKKFLLTLLFCIFANPIFAQTTNIQIQIDKSVKDNLIKIKNDLTKYIKDNICIDTNNNNTIEFQTELEETSCNPKKTIGDIYNCVCESNGNIATKINYITNFSGLNADTLVGKFEQIKQFYNTLDTIPEISMLEKEIDTTIKTQEENEKIKQGKEKEELLSKISTKLKQLIEEEIRLRKELGTDIPDDLETHFENIQDFIISNKETLDTAINAYIDTLRKNETLTNEDLNKYLDTNPESEIALTNRNIERLNNAQKELDEKLNKKIDDTYKNLLDPLQKLNKLECQIYGGIDVIATAPQKPFNNNTFTYQTIGISGKRITCNGKQLTIDNIKSTSTSEKSEWIKCIEKKANIIDYNNTGLQNYINEIEKENSCPIKECIHNVDKYEKWYDGNNNTKPEYKGQTPIIDKQLEQCKIDNFKCEGVEDFKKDKNTTLKELEEKCKKTQSEQEKTKVLSKLKSEFNKMCTIYTRIYTKDEKFETTERTSKENVKEKNPVKTLNDDEKNIIENYSEIITDYCKLYTNDKNLVTALGPEKCKDNKKVIELNGSTIINKVLSSYKKQTGINQTGFIPCVNAKQIVENINK